MDMELAAGGRVAGVDEAGRGPLAGPVVAAAVVLRADISSELAAMLDDSKKLTAAQRLAAFVALRASTAEIGVGAASVAADPRFLQPRPICLTSRSRTPPEFATQLTL